MKISKMDMSPMLNAYPDSVENNIEGMLGFLQKEEAQDIFGSFYILPSIFNTDLDRGFSIIDYNLNEIYATENDLDKLKELGINLKFDFVLNHASVLSKQFQDIIKKGQESEYKDFFINWNKFWEGKGEMTEEGYIQPYPELIQKMFFRKPGLPILMVRMPNGENVPYWNTFYQEVRYDKVQEQKNVYYQVNATYYSALGEDDRKMLIARAVQLFMPGKPQVWYLDLFAGKNDYEAVRRAGAGGHKEINRTNLSMEDIEEALKKDVVMTQLKLLRFRKNFPAFEKMNNIKIQAVGSTICFTWENEGYIARLNADFRTYKFKVEGIEPQGDTVFNLEN